MNTRYSRDGNPILKSSTPIKFHIVNLIITMDDSASALVTFRRIYITSQLEPLRSVLFSVL